MEVRNTKKFKASALLNSSVICFAVSAFSLLMIPIKPIDKDVKIILVSSLFWLGFVAGIALTIVLGFIRNKAGEKTYPYPGIICFFKNKTAVICDVLWIACAVTLIVLNIVLGTRHAVYTVFLSLSLFGCFMHAILNGNNFAFVNERGVSK